LKNSYAWFFILAWLLLLGGCAGVKTQPADTTTGATVPQQAGEGAIAESVPKTAMSGNHAVIALLDIAQRDSAAGKRETAGASLERALRIEPRNPWLWHELAQLRLDEGRYAQAITLAQKSNSFAAAERGLLARNWRLIANARVAQGDAAGAEQARKRAAELEQ
jgi:predicted Zn-dependent protease